MQIKTCVRIGPNFRQSPCLVSARIIFPPKLPKAQKEEAIILLMLLSLSFLSLLMFRIPFNLDDFLGKACFDIANGKPFLSQPSLKVGNDVLF